MGKDFYESFAESREIFSRANDVLGFDLAKICFEGPEERLTQTDISQPAIYVTSIACHAAARAQSKLGDGPFEFAGLSLGEYTALHLAGAMSFEDGLKLVAARGRYMQEAAVATPSTMVAVMGGDEAQITQLCEAQSQGEVLVPANFNAPGQIVVSGSKPACARFAEAASAAGLRAIPLTVAGAFHSPIMQSGADKMAEELKSVNLVTPSFPVYSNVTAKLHTTVDSIKELLVAQIVKPVRWEQTIAQIANVEGNKFIELAPGKVLTGLLKKQNRRADAVNLSTADTLK
jgi:[acyl-carrier-protein] S-malonyltransferase